MSYRWVLAVVSALLLASGCGSKAPTVATPTAKPSSSSAATSSETPSSEESAQAEAPQQTLDPDSCVEVTSASLDLAVAASAADAQKAADKFGKYNPPATVQEAIAHFVGTGGAKSDDPDFEGFNKRIDDWVKQVCPL
jgi:predicted small lipoprotein YifL